MGVPVNQKQIFFVPSGKIFYAAVKLSMKQTRRLDPTRPIDMHVHVVGNGSGGTGCWINVTGWHRPLAALMLRHIGLPGSAMTGDLDGLVVARLLEMLRTSSLGAAVILAQDDVHDENGKVIPGVGSFFVPNDYVLALAKKHPEFLPAVSIHPARPDAIEELERCLAAGAVMMKCLPNCQNINCSDRRLTKFWERMAEAKLPLLAHTGGEHTLPVVRAEYADPRILTLPLEIGVPVIAAHSATKSGLTDPEYFHVFAEMTRRFPNLYGDTSAFNVPLARPTRWQMPRRTAGFAHDPRERLSGAGEWAVGLDAGLYQLERLSAGAAKSECIGAGLSVESGDGLRARLFYPHH
jgi:hypothetical protein